MNTKVCSTCKTEKELNFFCKDKSRKDGICYTCKQCRNYYEIIRKNNDPIFKLGKNITKTIRSFLDNKTNKIRKNSKVKQILGCTLQEFKLHLESQFETWMNWDNRGLYNGQPNYGWDIDHIIPKATAKTEEDLIKLNHYTNLRPRCSYINRVEDRKKDKTDTSL